MMVLPIDLPLVTAADLEELRARHLEDRRSQGSESAPGAAVTVAPDRFRSGTNALVCSPPGCIRSASAMAASRPICEKRSGPERPTPASS